MNDNNNLRHLQNILLAINRLDNEYKTSHLEIPFFKITSIRNRIAHDYLSVSLETLYETVENDFSEFKTLIVNLINQEQNI